MSHAPYVHSRDAVKPHHVVWRHPVTKEPHYACVDTDTKSFYWTALIRDATVFPDRAAASSFRSNNARNVRSYTHLEPVEMENKE